MAQTRDFQELPSNIQDPFWDEISNKISTRKDIDKDYLITCYVPLKLTANGYDYTSEELDLLIRQIKANTHCKKIVLCLPSVDTRIQYPDIIVFEAERSKSTWVSILDSLCNAVKQDNELRSALLTDSEHKDEQMFILQEVADYLHLIGQRQRTDQPILILSEDLSHTLEFVVDHLEKFNYAELSLIIHQIERGDQVPEFDKEKYTGELLHASIQQLVRQNPELAEAFLRASAVEYINQGNFRRAAELLVEQGEMLAPEASMTSSPRGSEGSTPKEVSPAHSPVKPVSSRAAQGMFPTPERLSKVARKLVDHFESPDNGKKGEQLLDSSFTSNKF